ncbi:MAG: hypothetical protein AVDCRST_MAG75-2228 [uncultured Propionibacteriaceae bacterium]|uniref:Uncharacterized protein n=1 Tax=uncultured Propionibacteriaceae bacterium TaxID=257457 RepID=A0A6J4P0K0_9ACTN|nr:MAG: hypothetical protein AVDCRST_MAG75-2228 [uncultured Propionibacteriaceae bacterium]
MLGPTRELVAQLNQRARTHRLNGKEIGPTVRLGDGNQASLGDVVITRTNDRRLRLGGDWVKNGDRWTITAVKRDGGLTVRHNRSHHTTRLPAGYVQASTGLGYATTIHSAQGVTCDTMHGLACGQETRQQLYTMLTRGRTANHLYLQVVGGGDPHSLIRPETVTPRTPTELLEQIPPATTPPPPPPTCSATSPTPPPGCTTRPSATPTASAPQPNTPLDPPLSRHWMPTPTGWCPG